MPKVNIIVHHLLCAEGIHPQLFVFILFSISRRVHVSEAMLHVVQVLVIGKISQAAILAAAAYRNHETFKRQTGITNSRLIYDKEHHDTKVPFDYKTV